MAVIFAPGLHTYNQAPGSESWRPAPGSNTPPQLGLCATIVKLWLEQLCSANIDDLIDEFFSTVLR
jgi:hypothetical protein